jgi:predicted TIM-barrel fold metal-dependent hydrolase
MLVFSIAIAPSAFAQSAARGPIIDVHMHSRLPEQFAGGAPPNPATGLPGKATTADELLRKTIAAMKRYGIVKGFVSSGFKPFESIAPWLDAAPSLFIGSCGIATNGMENSPTVERVRSEIAVHRIAALGEIGAQYAGITPSDERLEPYFALAEELDLPVGIHTGLAEPGAPFHGNPNFRVALGNPILLEPVLIRHPKLRLYLMHAGWPYLEETKAILHVYPQVYVDVAIIDWAIPRSEFHEYLRALIRAGFEQRIMFGSDQMFWPEAIGMAVEGVDSAAFLTRSAKRDIFYNNAARFFRLQ